MTEAETVKQQDDAHPCVRCGRPTWSATGVCAPCTRGAPPSEPAAQSPAPSEPAFVFTVDGDGRLEQEIPCLACGYNLAGLLPAGVCPECSTEVERSLRGDQLYFAHPAWVARLAKGMLWILVGAGASIIMGFALVPVVILGASTGAVPMIAAAVVGVLPAIFTVYGVWLTTTPDPAHLETTPITARSLARWCMMLQLVAAPMQAAGQPAGGMMMPTAGMSGLQITLLFIGATVGLASLVGFVAGLVYLRRLARRLPRSGLVGQTTVVMWGYGAVQALGVIFALVVMSTMPGLTGVMRGGGAATVQGGLIAISIGGCVFGIGGLVFGIWAIVLVIQYRSAFARAAETARVNWHGPQPTPAT